VSGERLVCQLDWGREYDLTQAYRYRPHIDFLNLKTDDDLSGFVRLRGPLWLHPFSGEPEERKQRYWNFHRALRARLRLIDAFKSRDKSPLVSAILESVAAEEKHLEFGQESYDGMGGVGFGASLLNLLHGQGDTPPEDWIPRAGLAQLRDVAAFCIGGAFSVGSRLNAAWHDGHPEIGWKPDVQSLEQAIEWMFWHDIAGSRPLTFCADKGCGKAFLPQSEHARKFCSFNCAHRSAVREWRHRQRESKRQRGKRP
jgi:hypothetical protein